MDGFANHNRLYYLSMYRQYQGDDDDGRLLICIIGSNCLLGPMVVVSSHIRFEGTLTHRRTADSSSQKMRLTRYWIETATYIFSFIFADAQRMYC